MTRLSVCEICGDDAVIVVQDCKEIEPVKKGAILWRAFEVDGPPHSLCDKHKRDSIKTFRDGTRIAGEVERCLAMLGIGKTN